VIVTAILTPILTAFVHRRLKRRLVAAETDATASTESVQVEHPQPVINR
jgi:2-keto-3-deoxygluconate permease